MKKILSKSQLYTLLESMRLINSTLDLDELLYIIMQEITENLSADRSTLYIVDEERGEIWSKIAQGNTKIEIRQSIGKGISGYVAETGETINIIDAYQDHRFNPEFDKKTGYRTKSILCMPVFDKMKKIIAILQVLNKKNGCFTKEDEAFTSALSDHIALAIQNAQLYKEALERQKLEKEINIAGEIQQMLLPKNIPTSQHYDFFAFHQPSRRIGGDYYDFFYDSEYLYLVLADVAGKGIPAAILMANLQATTHNLLEKYHSNPELVKAINKQLYSVTTPDKYATLVWGELDTHKHIFKYINAGNIPPFLYQREEIDITIKNLSEGGIPLGMFPEADFTEGSLVLKPMDLLLICSDGITEAQDFRGNMFEEGRLHKIVSDNFHLHIQDIGSEIIKKVQDFSRDGIYEDDITLILLRRK
jgi:sigma-B regulation protein RsbU (phosphoserine phosphatase)